MEFFRCKITIRCVQTLSIIEYLDILKDRTSGLFSSSKSATV